jgi:hypothetical protein
MKILLPLLLAFTLQAAPSTRESVLNKLNNTIIESIDLNDLTIEEIAGILHSKSGNKINFIYLKKQKPEAPKAPPVNNAPQMLDPATGLPIMLPPPFLPQVAQEPASPRIKASRVSLKNVTLRQLLEISTLCFDQPMSYVITDFGVVFIHRDKDEKGLVSRTFIIRRNVFNKKSLK